MSAAPTTPTRAPEPGGWGERVAPARLGRDFRWLLASSWTTNLGDGLALAAAPLLVASLTDSPGLVALAATAAWAPSLLFGLLAGVYTDRHDRRRLVLVGNALRVLLVATLAIAVLADTATIGFALVVMLALGSAEVFVDNAAATFTPMLVAREDLALANSRVLTGFITLNQLAGPLCGAVLFALHPAAPFLVQALTALLGWAFMTRVRPPDHRTGGPAARTVLHELREGLRWVWHHAAVRTLVLTIFIFNLTFGAAWSVLVLYATQRLGLAEAGFGLVTGVGAAGGLLGTVCYGWLTRRLSLGTIMRIGLVIETLTHLVLALTTSPWVALPVFFVFGAHAFIWGTTSMTVRQRAVPAELQGRVGGINGFGVFAGLVIGSGIGGLIAEQAGVVGPFWFAFGGSVLFLVLLWRQLAHIAHADEQGPAADDAAPRDEARG
ncbi:MFS transporter [Nocardioides sp.]|uniref:MFS transporter n=1 Tax=Nocardioides sp. TaxID=35761 RepID=UPI0035199B53